MKNLGVPGDFKRQRRGWNNSQGDYGEIEYEGTQTYIETLFPTLRGGNILETEITHSGAKWILRCRVAIAAAPGSTAEVVDDVRMSINRVQKSLYEPPIGGDVTAEELRLIKRAAATQSNKDFLEVYGAAVLAGNTPGRTTAEKDILDLAALALAGVTHRVVSQPILYRTRSAPDGHQWPGHTNWVGKNLSFAQLFDDADLGGLLNFTLPATGSPVAWNGLSFVYGWVKYEPWYDTAAGNRTVEYLQYEYGLWPVKFYPLAS